MMAKIKYLHLYLSLITSYKKINFLLQSLIIESYFNRFLQMYAHQYHNLCEPYWSLE
jgi:hypothetical protein